MLIFPEGTCVNNKYCVMFKKGAFELGAEVFPIAIKYKYASSTIPRLTSCADTDSYVASCSKEFCDPFWNSQKDSFWFHVFKLMTNWAVVCDVYYLPAQTIQPGEQPTDFARRVKVRTHTAPSQHLIATTRRSINPLLALGSNRK